MVINRLLKLSVIMLLMMMMMIMSNDEFFFEASSGVRIYQEAAVAESIRIVALR